MIAYKLLAIGWSISGWWVRITIFPCKRFSLTSYHMFFLLNSLRQYFYIECKDCIYAIILVGWLISIGTCCITCHIMPNDMLSIAEYSILNHLYWLWQYGELQCIYDTITCQCILNSMSKCTRLIIYITIPCIWLTIAYNLCFSDELSSRQYGQIQSSNTITTIDILDCNRINACRIIALSIPPIILTITNHSILNLSRWMNIYREGVGSCNFIATIILNN